MDLLPDLLCPEKKHGDLKQWKRGFSQQEWVSHDAKQRLQPARHWGLMRKFVNEHRVILTSFASPYQRFLMSLACCHLFKSNPRPVHIPIG